MRDWSDDERVSHTFFIIPNLRAIELQQMMLLVHHKYSSIKGANSTDPIAQQVT